MSKMYEKAITWLKENAAGHGGAAELMRAAKASKPSWYKLLRGKDVYSATLMDWLDNLGFRIVAPDEGGADLSREVCFVSAKISPAGGGLPGPDAEDYIAVPLVDEVGAGPGIIPQGEFKSWFLVWRHQESVRNKSNLIAVRIARGSDSMIPTLYPDDVVLVSRNDTEIATGRMYLVMDPEGSGKIKRVSAHYLPGEKDYQITFYSDNAAEYPPDVYHLNRDFDGDWGRAVVGRVIWAWSDVRGK